MITLKAPKNQPTHKKRNLNIPAQYIRTAFPPSHQVINIVAIYIVRFDRKIKGTKDIMVQKKPTDSSSRGSVRNVNFSARM